MLSRWMKEDTQSINNECKLQLELSKLNSHANKNARMLFSFQLLSIDWLTVIVSNQWKSFELYENTVLIMMSSITEKYIIKTLVRVIHVVRWQVLKEIQLQIHLTSNSINLTLCRKHFGKKICRQTMSSTAVMFQTKFKFARPDLTAQHLINVYQTSHGLTKREVKSEWRRSCDWLMNG